MRAAIDHRQLRLRAIFVNRRTQIERWQQGR